MLPRRRPSVRTPRATLRLAASAHDARSRLRRAPRPRQLIPPVVRPARHAPGLPDSTPASCSPPVARPARRGHPSGRPHPTRCLCSPHISLSISRPMIAERFPQPQMPPGCLAAATPLMAAGRTCRGASGRSRLSLGHPRARPDAGGGRTPPLAAGSHPEDQN